MNTDIDAVLRLWRGGLDTVDIARALGCKEHEAARALRHARETVRERQQQTKGTIT